ncbi:L-lactate MFS transporter [Alkalibacterium pelagium]|uniref:MFS transporter, OFA family, oxalate/formate antiporter n=1 Tax=Alkalibacterium pelagium TaxID=426702 RepID=A0A1H7P4G2_9LACT|nr:OFA family MFS transporter [Alkalibacterium pelagium]GEN51543.1 MFS transporter [Alkalibacterium pelagium]SEL30499.1 MFS transporter, OFA family, oxalate/formate antiporter [Alkalibacterium pelagium]
MTEQKNRWLILIAAIVTNLSLGAGYAWSVFQTALLAENPGWSLSETSLAFSISFAMVPVGMIICGPIVDKHGGKKIVMAAGLLFGLGMFLTGFASSILMLYMTYGVILGLGIGAGYGTATALTVKWFPDKKGLAGGLTAAGFGSGAILLAPIATAMIDSVGVSQTFRLLGIILLVVICAASFIMENPPAKPVVSGVTADEGSTFKDMLREGNFWILWGVYIFAATSGMMIIGHAANLADYYSLGSGAVIVMIVGLANTLGRIFWGSVSDRIGRYKTVMTMFAVSGAGLLSLNFADQLGAVAGIIGLICIALSFGGFLGSFPGITAENWGASKAAANYGWMFTAYGIASIMGPSLASSIREATGSYSMALIISTGMAVAGIGLIAWYMKRISKFQVAGDTA